MIALALTHALLAVFAAQSSAAPAAAYADRYATVNGLRLHYLEWGNPANPPMILLHGIARHAHTFDHLAPHFARNYHVLALDMRGHGDSAWDPAGAYLVEDHVRDLDALVRQLESAQVDAAREFDGRACGAGLRRHAPGTGGSS